MWGVGWLARALCLERGGWAGHVGTVTTRYRLALIFFFWKYKVGPCAQKPVASYGWCLGLNQVSVFSCSAFHGWPQSVKPKRTITSKREGVIRCGAPSSWHVFCAGMWSCVCFISVQVKPENGRGASFLAACSLALGGLHKLAVPSRAFTTAQGDVSTNYTARIGARMNGISTREVEYT